jgi:hypothetical protein
MIGQRARRTQWMILTCHPERFRTLADAHLVRIGSRSASGKST